MLVIISRHPLALICQGMLLLGGMHCGWAGFGPFQMSFRPSEASGEIFCKVDGSSGWERTKPDFTAGLRCVLKFFSFNSLVSSEVLFLHTTDLITVGLASVCRFFVDEVVCTKKFIDRATNVSPVNVFPPVSVYTLQNLF